MSHVPAPILDAAARLVTHRGPKGLTMSRLARATGLSRASLYRSTGGREALLDALAERGEDVGDRKRTRDRILAGAREVFGRAGFDAAAIEEIAARAKVGVATIYRHFGDKEGLVLAFVDELAPRRAVREAKLAFTGDLRVDLLALATRMLEGMQQDAPLMRLFLIEALRGSPLLPHVRAMSPIRMSSTVAAVLGRHVGRELRSDLAVQGLANSFGSMVLSAGLLVPILRGEPTPAPAEVAGSIVTTFLDGALERKPST